MVDDLEKRLSHYRADLDDAVAADLARRHLVSRESGFHDADPFPLDTDHLIRMEPTMAASYDRRRVTSVVAALGVAAAAVVAIAFVVIRDADDVTPSDEPSPTVTVPIECELELCPWSPELTAQTLGIPIASKGNLPLVAVSPDGTLVVLDLEAETLTWYEKEPRVVPFTLEPPNSIDANSGLMAIGPHDIAYMAVGPRPSYFVAVAPSGAEITRVDTPYGSPVWYPAATGLVATPGGQDPLMPWVDLDGNPITDRRPYATATVTYVGLEVRFGEREWLVAGEAWPVHPALMGFLARSDGGVVMVIGAYGPPSNVPSNVPLKLLELSTDGTIERYFVDSFPTLLSDGSLIVEHNLQLVRLTPPA
jgi:hypothetical protein